MKKGPSVAILGLLSAPLMNSNEISLRNNGKLGTAATLSLYILLHLVLFKKEFCNCDGITSETQFLYDSVSVMFSRFRCSVLKKGEKRGKVVKW